MMNPPEKLKLKESNNASKSWQEFKQAWEVYEIASGVISKEPLVRLATFLHVAGPDAHEKYTGFLFANEEEKQDLAAVIAKFDQDCKTNVNILSERSKFFARKQKENETYDQYVTELRKLSSLCEFSNPQEALRDQFAINIKNRKAKERLLIVAQSNYKELTFEKAISIVKSLEAIHQCSDNEIARTEETEKMEVDRITNASSNIDKTKQERTIKNCKFCGQNHVYLKCPAYGKTCLYCHGKNHFSKVCKKKKDVNQINEVRSSDLSDPEII